MSVHLHDAAAPTFLRVLAAMESWLDKAASHAADKKFDPEILLQARLAPDMLPLLGQYALATAFAKNTMCRLAGQTPPDFPDAEKTIADVRARIARARGIVESITRDDFKDAATREITFQAGPDTKLTLSGSDYFFGFSLPNFYFHATTAYALLRHNGLPLGKMDFMGAAPK
ncbi:MAG: DUF1993 domain-containing protein [Caulobacterales bacterium]